MIYVVGAGAVGTVMAAYLSRAGRDVSLYAREKDRAPFAALPDIRVDDVRGRIACQTKRPPVSDRLDLREGDVLLLCVKASALNNVLGTVGVPPLGCHLVSTLNGVAPLRILRRAWPQHIVTPLSIMMNSQLESTLHARLTTRPEIFLGSDDTYLQRLFQGTGIRCVIADGDSAVWGKLLINLANAICALTRTTFRDLFVLRALRRIYVAVLDEATGALNASRTPWHLPLAVPYGIYRWMLLKGGPLPWWVAHYRNGVGEGAYPSMVADVRAGRGTEVRELNGEIVALGERHGVAAPINRRLVELIETSPCPPTLSPEQLHDALGIRELEST